MEACGLYSVLVVGFRFLHTTDNRKAPNIVWIVFTTTITRGGGDSNIQLIVGNSKTKILKVSGTCFVGVEQLNRKNVVVPVSIFFCLKLTPYKV